MADLPAPLTPSSCDLRGLPFMPLHVGRLLDSDLFALSTGDEFKAAVALWCKSWTQVPAASLPDDDRVLAFLSGAGARWRKVRDIALRGWVKCQDGRLYHPTVAEMAIEAGERRGDWNEKNDNKTERQRRWRVRCKVLSERLRAAGVTPPKGSSLDALEALCRHHGVDACVDGETSTVDAGEIGKTGTGTGTGTKEEEKEKEDHPPAEPLAAAAAPDGAGKSYAFEGKVIKLNDVDFARWKKTFHAIPDIVAELESLDAWYRDQPEEKRKKWFHGVSGALGRKHQEIVAQRSGGGAAVPAGIC